MRSEPTGTAWDVSRRQRRLGAPELRVVAERFPPGSDGPQTLADMEEALAEVKRVLGEQLQRLWIEQQEGEAANRTDCAACAGAARFCGHRERLVVTRHGKLRFTRRYYHCRGCHRGFAPLDRHLGLDGFGTSPQVRAWLADLGRDGAFESAARRLETFTALRLSESTAARAAGRRGAEGAPVALPRSERPSTAGEEVRSAAARGPSCLHVCKRNGRS